MGLRCVTKCSVHLLVSPRKLIFFTFVNNEFFLQLYDFLYVLAEDMESVPLHGMETYAAGGTIILCVFSLFNNFINLGKSFGILYAKLILYNLVGEPEIQEIQDGEIAVSGGCGGDIVSGGGGGVKQHAGVYFLNLMKISICQHFHINLLQE